MVLQRHSYILAVSGILDVSKTNIQLSQAYEHAWAIVQYFGDIEITISMLLQFDKLWVVVETCLP